MNRKNMQKLIDALEAGPLKFGRRKVGFNMNSYIQRREMVLDHSGNKCGTVACLAGWTTLLSGCVLTPDFEYGGFDNVSAHHVARDWLGLSDDAACRLFMPDQPSLQWQDITLPQAVTTLKKMMASTDADPMPDWSHATGGFTP